MRQPTDKEINDYIEYCFREKMKDENEEDYSENFIIMDYMYMKNGFEFEYWYEFNDKLIEEMTKRGYRYSRCEEDIEFFK